jgi:hypothetical protein
MKVNARIDEPIFLTPAFDSDMIANTTAGLNSDT